MPKWVCLCGNVIDQSPVPCADEWLFIADSKYDAAVEDGAPLHELMSRLLLCRACARIYLFPPAGGEPAVYALESGVFPGVADGGETPVAPADDYRRPRRR